MKEIHEYKKVDRFLADIKESGITYDKLRPVLFGRQAIVFIKAVRKHGQPAFAALKKYHELRYMASVAIMEFIKQKAT